LYAKNFCCWVMSAIFLAIIVTTSVIVATQQQSLVSSSVTIYVPDDYAKIQWAIDNATAGDTIIVKSGTYYEKVNVIKQLILRGVDTGTDKPVVDTCGHGNAIELYADGITLEGFNVTNSGSTWYDSGIIIHSSNNIISANTISNNAYCIRIRGSSNINNNNIITGNIIRSNYGFGIHIDGYSSNNTITGNNVSSNSDSGIYLWYSNNNIISSNMISNNNRGLYFGSSCDNNTITDNMISSNNCGILLSRSKNNTLSSNTVTKTYTYNGLCLVESDNNIIDGNTVSNNYDNGILLDRSKNNTISSNTIGNNILKGIYLDSTSNHNNIADNNISSNYDDGIYLASSNSNTIADNNVSNNDNGIYIGYSNSNKICFNDFINNYNNVYSSDSSNNIWNSTEKITYSYKGATYENYMGNYWDDYPGNDAESDGIGDTPYSINTDKDNYPLMESWETYFATVPLVFDMDSGTYPSIMGNHTGTIKPNHDVIVNRMYTYPCAGTGGHSEYVKFENASWNITANWKGYKGDWHNITFDEHFTLYAGFEYNYTICTGSYPRIHHNKTLTVPDGEITCTEFIDANGKRYDDWIPAIKLFL